MEDINTVGTTGKTVEQIASDWKNTKMTKFEIVKHFVEICKLDEEALAREIEETKKWQHDVLELQNQNKMVWEIVEKKDKEIQELEKDAEWWKKEVLRLQQHIGVLVLKAE